MRIMKLTGVTVKPATAGIYVSKKTQQKYFNIWHGARGMKTWCCGLNKRLFNPDDTKELTLELVDNDYAIKQVDGLSNPNGRPFYSIYKDTVETHLNDILLLWEIPNKRYTEVTYSISGEAHVIGEGETGSNRDNISYISPAPVLEIYGSCTLVWAGKNTDNQSISQTITYDYATAQFNINPMELLKYIGE